MNENEKIKEMIINLEVLTNILGEERIQEIAEEYGKHVSIHLYGQELADETGVAVRTIALIETKEGSNPSVGTLKRLLAYFEITFEELFPREY